MADISKIKLPNGTTYDVNARNGIYYVKGTQTAVTGSWTGVIPVPALYDGLTIMYYLPYAGSGSATLNLTLSDGTTTGAKNCYFRKNDRLTTHYVSGSNFALTYHSAGSITIDGTATTDDRWVVTANYTDGNDTSYYDRVIYVYAKAGSNKIFPYTIVCQLPDGRWESIVTSSSTGTGKSRNSHGFLFGQIGLMYANATYNENELIGNYNFWWRYTGVIDHRYSFNTANNSTSGLTSQQPVYLVGSIGNDGLFYLDATKWWTQTLPSTADGKIYIHIGNCYDYYRMTFDGKLKAFVYTNGHIREYSQDAATVGGHTVAKDVPSNAVFTDNNTTYTLSTSGNNIVLTPSSGSANTITVPYATNAGKVNNLTVQTAVPTNAKFTDTTYTFANGTNGFTVTPSGGSAQTVTVTPSITNNVTGSGTSGYLAKFNGAHTITNGPQLGSSTTTYLNNAGSWATPPDTKNTAGSTNTSSKIFLIGATSQAANPQTYSNSGVWVNGSGELSSHTWSVKNGNLYARAECYVDAEDRGRINVYDENGIGRIMLTGNNGITLNDSSDTTTIFLDSEDGRVECEKMSYTNEAVTYSKSSGSWTFASGEYTRSGQVVQLVLQFHGGSSNVSVGGNAINGTVNGIPNPPRTVRLQGYYSGTVLMGELTASGGFNVRILSQALNLSSSNTATISGTYIVED